MTMRQYLGYFIVHSNVRDAEMKIIEKQKLCKKQEWLKKVIEFWKRKQKRKVVKQKYEKRN